MLAAVTRGFRFREQYWVAAPVYCKGWRLVEFCLIRASSHHLDSVPPALFRRVQAGICTRGDVLNVVAVGEGRYPTTSLL